MERALWWCYPVPGAAKHPWCPWSQGATSKSTQHPDPHPPPPLLTLSPSPVGYLSQAIGPCAGGEVDGDWIGDWADPCFSMHQCSPGKKGRGWRGQRWWCSKIGVIWGFAGGEGHGWRDEEDEEEERGKKVEVSAELCNAAPPVFNWKAFKLHKLIKEKKMMM